MTKPSIPIPSPQEREATLFALALEKPAAERASFLQTICGTDTALRQRLDALLAAHEQPETVLESPTIRRDAPRRDELRESPFSHQGAAKVQGLVELGPPGDAPDEAVGQTLGRYKLLERVGEGGCGVVYVAEQTEPVRRRVALKVIKLGMDTKQVVARFEAERQALAMMDHPNIAKVLDAGTTGPAGGPGSQISNLKSQIAESRPYFVMELVRGIRITDYCDQANLTTKERLDLFIKVCQAIQHAHQKGIIHRDIKPSNILVTLHDAVRCEGTHGLRHRRDAQDDPGERAATPEHEAESNARSRRRQSAQINFGFGDPHGGRDQGRLTSAATVEGADRAREGRPRLDRDEVPGEGSDPA